MGSDRTLRYYCWDISYATSMEKELSILMRLNVCLPHDSIILLLDISFKRAYMNVTAILLKIPGKNSHIHQFIG
jgi:hypothetical protein